MVEFCARFEECSLVEQNIVGLLRPTDDLSTMSEKPQASPPSMPVFASTHDAAARKVPRMFQGTVFSAPRCGQVGAVYISAERELCGVVCWA